MWKLQQKSLSEAGMLRFQVVEDSQVVRFADVLKLWQEDTEFSLWFTEMLAALPFTAFRWETPPVTASTLSRLFEFVIIDSPTLDRPVDRGAFAEHFSIVPHEAVVSFSNLGRDAILIVPCPASAELDYCHLADFVRRAPQAQVLEFWKTIGSVMQKRVSEQPVWLSTAGAGVAWLHVRLDDRPKYYRYQPYCTLPTSESK